MKSISTTLSNTALDLIALGIRSVKIESLFTELPLLDADKFGSVSILGVGKASIPMSQQCKAWLEASAFKGLVRSCLTVPHTYVDGKIDVEGVFAAGHPKPDRDSVRAGRRAIDFVRDLGKEDLLICLISGGGSALWAEPVEEISFQDLLSTSEILLTLGSNIQETNAIRSRITTTGAGKLARLAHPAEIRSLILSDVPENDPSIIASGPTSKPRPIQEMHSVLEQYHLEKHLPKSVNLFLKALKEDPFEMETNSTIIGSNLVATQAMAERSKSLGYVSSHVTLEGDVNEMAKAVASIARNRSNGQSECVIFGGETTVNVTGDGKGGRNQELVLATMLQLGAFDRKYTFAAAGTDGIDGFSNAAGAWIDDRSLNRAIDLNLDPADYLDRNDSHNFFDKLKQQIITGPTHTNVMDIAVLIVE